MAISPRMSAVNAILRYVRRGRVAAVANLTATEAEVIEYHNGAPDEDRERVEGYLQRCVFDDSVTLDVLLAAPHTGPYLASVLHDGQWRFGQRVMLISISV